MLIAMAHPSRVLNLDMKAKLCMPKSYYFIYTAHHFTPHGRYELNKLNSLPMCGFIAQLVEHRTGIAEVTGSNPVEALIFSGFFFPIA